MINVPGQMYSSSSSSSSPPTPMHSTTNTLRAFRYHPTPSTTAMVSTPRTAVAAAASTATDTAGPSKRSSLLGRRSTKGKERAATFSSAPPDLQLADPFAAHSNTSHSFIPYPDSLHTTTTTTAAAAGAASTDDHAQSSLASAPSSSPLRRSRTSLLSSASNAFSARFRRRPKTAPTTSPSPQEEDCAVLDIRAEDAERERLKEAAAQSLGLVRETQSVLESVDEDSDLLFFDSSIDDSGGPSSFSPLDDPPLSPNNNNTTNPSYPIALGFAGRLRSGSVQTARSFGTGRARASSSPPPPSTLTHNNVTHIQQQQQQQQQPLSIQPPPPFPSTPAALAPLVQLSGALPKYSPGSALIPFGRAWKARYLVLSTPSLSPRMASHSSSWGGPSASGPVARTAAAAPAYLHLFKSAGPDEREIERLEITEDGAAFVADEEVGGRKGVVKIAGVDAGSAGSPSTGGGEGRSRPGTATSSNKSYGSPAASAEGEGSEQGQAKATWCFQIQDAAEAQRWISAVKQAILAQRSARAGLGPSFSGAGEPRGDIDTVLSMRAQGTNVALLPSPSRSTFSAGSAGPGTLSSPPPSRPASALAQAFSASAPMNTPHPLPLPQPTPLGVGYGSYHPYGGGGGGGGTTPPHSLRLSSTTPSAKPPLARTTTGPTAVAALRGLFVGATQRPRSPSSASTLDGRATPDYGPPPSLLSIITSPGTLERDRGVPPATAPPLAPLPSHPASSGSPTFSAAQIHSAIVAALERKIVEDPMDEELDGMAADRSLSPGAGMQPPTRHRSTGSMSLQPPPRRRPWTMSNVPPTVPATPPETSLTPPPSVLGGSLTPSATPTSPPSSSAGALTPSSLELTPTSGIHNLAFFGTPEQKPRAPSLSSVSTFTSESAVGGSGVERRRSGASASGRRWSRTSSGFLPKRMTPPAGPPPPVPAGGGSLGRNGMTMTTTTTTTTTTTATRLQIPHHPYASPTLSAGSSFFEYEQRPESVASDRSSARHSPFGAHAFAPRTHRLSGASSVQSATSGGALSAFGFTRAMPKGRMSMPPPARPAPSMALPPTPVDATDHTRAKSAHRAFRLSLSPPKQPPATMLPPRPDEAISARHARRKSGSAVTSPSGTQVLVGPSVTLASSKTAAAALIPVTHESSHGSTQSSRTASLRQRLRMLSAPSAPSSVSRNTSSTPFDPVPGSRSGTPSPVPATPIGEHIVPRGEELDYFLHMDDDSPSSSPSSRPSSSSRPIRAPTPVLTGPPPASPPPPPPAGLLAEGDDAPGPRALSPPPPRRGSRQLGGVEMERLRQDAIAAQVAQQAGSDRTPAPLARQVSLLPLGVVGS